MPSEGRIAGGPWQGAPASEGRRNYTAALTKSPARRPLSSEQSTAEFAAVWIAARYGVPVALAGTVAALAGLGGVAR